MYTLNWHSTLRTYSQRGKSNSSTITNSNNETKRHTVIICISKNTTTDWLCDDKVSCNQSINSQTADVWVSAVDTFACGSSWRCVTWSRSCRSADSVASHRPGCAALSRGSWSQAWTCRVWHSTDTSAAGNKTGACCKSRVQRQVSIKGVQAL